MCTLYSRKNTVLTHLFIFASFCFHARHDCHSPYFSTRWFSSTFHHLFKCIPSPNVGETATNICFEWRVFSMCIFNILSKLSKFIMKAPTKTTTARACVCVCAWKYSDIAWFDNDWTFIINFSIFYPLRWRLFVTWMELYHSSYAHNGHTRILHLDNN